MSLAGLGGFLVVFIACGAIVLYFEGKHDR